MIRTIRSGRVIEKSQFYLGERKPRKPRRKGSSSIAKKDQNLKTAERRLAQTLNCNFGEGDVFLTLTYDEEHLSALGSDPGKAADRTCALFIRRLSRELGKLGIKQKLVWITADKDEGSLEDVRLHHHVIIKREGFEVGKLLAVAGRTVEDIWGQGLTSFELLREQDDYTPLAVYLVRQAINGPDAKKWHPSRGLEKPIVKNEVLVTKVKELRAPGGVEVKEIGRFDVETGSHYIRYIAPDKTGERMAKKISELEEDIRWLREELKDIPFKHSRTAVSRMIEEKEVELRKLRQKTGLF